MRYFVLFIAAVLMIAPGPVSASGFGLYEFSARGNALGNTMAGRADDPSTIATNAAGLTRLEGTQVTLGLTGIAPALDMIETSTGQVTAGKKNLWVPPHFYLTQNSADSPFAFGLGVFSRFGLGTEMPQDWALARDFYYAELQTVSLVPSLAFQVTDRFSVSAGVEYLRMLSFKIDSDSSHLDADGDGWGVHLGAHFALNDQWHFGASFKSQVSINADGRMAVPGLGYDDWATGSVVLPRAYQAGVVYYPTDKLSVSADVVYTGWSSYTDLDIDFGLGSIAQPKNWNDTWRIGLGAEYALSETWAVRGSWVWDQSPVDPDYADFLVPCNDRHILGLGLGYTQGRLSIDGGYNYLMMSDRHYSTASGYSGFQTDKNRAHIVGISFSWKF